MGPRPLNPEWYCPASCSSTSRRAAISILRAFLNSSAVVRDMGYRTRRCYKKSRRTPAARPPPAVLLVAAGGKMGARPDARGPPPPRRQPQRPRGRAAELDQLREL